MNWKDILIKITNGVDNIPSPFAKGAFIEYHYVMVNTSDRIGFLVAWCTGTHKGIQISRVEVPQNVSYLTVDEFKKIKLPKIKWVDAI